MIPYAVVAWDKVHGSTLLLGERMAWAKGTLGRSIQRPAQARRPSKPVAKSESHRVAPVSRALMVPNVAT